jgi:hypothetical protein
MKLQKLELEQQLQRNAQTTSLQASQSQVQLAFCAEHVLGHRQVQSDHAMPIERLPSTMFF